MLLKASSSAARVPQAKSLLLSKSWHRSAGMLRVAPAAAAAAAGSPRGGSDAGSASPTALGTSPRLGGAAGYLDVPPPPATRSPLWCEPGNPGGPPAELARRIYCNRSLNMKHIKAVGFDMDYTIAQYKPKAFEELAYRATVDKLVNVYGYPTTLRALEFDYSWMARGLVVDKRRGNVIKIDRHKYVKIAYHGFARLSNEERDRTYNWGAVRDEFDEPDYSMVDTLFSLAESHLWSQLVELADADPSSVPHGTDYRLIWRDVRSAVDLCHRDGTLKREVAADPAKYIHDDPHLVPMLLMLKRSGRKLFLATNSLWDYTSVVMNWCCGRLAGKRRTDDWLRLFDAVIVGCAKPGFFSERRPLFAVDPTDGSLRNTDGGAPIIPIGYDDLPADAAASTARMLDIAADDRAAVFQGGHFLDLHKMLGVGSGTEVLYVGDHIYGDILRSKKSLGWRTMLVVPELETELECEAAHAGARAELAALRAQRDTLDDEIQRVEWALRFGSGGGVGADGGGVGGSSGHAAAPSSSSSSNGANGNGSGNNNNGARAERLEELKAQRAAVKARHSEALRAYHEAFHPVWGRLLKTGVQASAYGHLIDRYACLYTSHAANLSFYSPERAYRGRADVMAHEMGCDSGVV